MHMCIQTDLRFCVFVKGCTWGSNGKYLLETWSRGTRSVVRWHFQNGVNSFSWSETNKQNSGLKTYFGWLQGREWGEDEIYEQHRVTLGDSRVTVFYPGEPRMTISMNDGKGSPWGGVLRNYGTTTPRRGLSFMCPSWSLAGALHLFSRRK